MGERRKVGLVGAVSIGVGGMVGGGIFAVLGVAATEARGATPLAFLLAGTIAALTAYSYGRLAAHFQSAGGTVTFIDRVFGVHALTGAVNVVLWVGYIATTALYVAAFANYAATLLPYEVNAGSLLMRSLVLFGILLPWAFNLASAGLVAKSEGVIVGVKLAILLVVVAAGAPSVAFERVAPTTTWPPLGTVFAAGMLIFVAYEGFELIANASADIVNPTRNLPRAFALAVGFVIVLYIAIAVVVVGALTPEEIAQSAEIALARAAQASLGQVGFTLVAISAVLATVSATTATLYGAARLSFSLATDGELSRFFQKKQWNQPVGLHVTALGGLAIALTLPLESISTVCSAIFLLVFAVVNAAACRSATAVGASRSITTLGAVGCLAALCALLARSWAQDPVGVFALVILLIAAWFSEVLVLRHMRPETGSRWS